ncbi:hypothetical protein ACFOKI_07855 [Sphingomonas qilianensis]|uniref:MarR family transcriptional regulator n=1 Tax=Sphingomonas qilianensis TaxID=1736690 RepID=A0ABU9XTC8_9SPHN
MPDNAPKAGWHGAERIGAAGSGRPTAHDTATRMLAFNTARLAAFAPHGLIVSDAAWDVLLALFVAQERGLRLTIATLCDELPMPRASTLRWVRALHASGLLQEDDRSAGLTAAARLTPAADAALRGLIER